MSHHPMRINVGCGTDYRDGFVNVDGSATLPRVDRRVELGRERLRDHFPVEQVDQILANDVLEHFHHWEAVAMLRDFYELLRSGGHCEIRVPDAGYILRTPRYGIERKLSLLFGGQDVPQGVDPAMDASRAANPGFFCHRYGWTRRRMKAELRSVGFVRIRTRRAGTNFVAWGTKP